MEMRHMSLGSLRSAMRTGSRPELGVPASLDVETGTVFKKERIVRPISAEVCALIWDYPNLVPPKGRTRSALAQHGMRDCLDGPPGKVARTVLFHVLEQTLPIWGTRGEPAEVGGLEGKVDGRYLTVARADDAEVELEVWKVPGEMEEEVLARGVVRLFFHRVWRRRITRKAVKWLRANGWRKRDREVIRDAIGRNAWSKWFDWSDGSTLHFWLWPEEWRLDM
eukprot:scaffold201304_cov46-Attheya_sp.AAC.1